MTTGVDIRKIFDRDIDQAYSDFESTAQKTSRMKVAMINTIEKIYRGLDTQKDNDDIRSLIVVDRLFYLNSGVLPIAPYPITSVSYVVDTALGITNVTIIIGGGHTFTADDLADLVFNNESSSGLSSPFTGVSWSIASGTSLTGIIPAVVTGSYLSGSVSVSSNRSMVNNYMHTLAVKPLYFEPVKTGFDIITNVSGNRIRFQRQNNLRTGDLIKIDTTPALQAYQTEYYIEKLNLTDFKLFFDEEMTLPATLSSIPAGTKYGVRVITGDYAEPMAAHELVSRFIGTHPKFPGYLIDSNRIIFRPNQRRPLKAYLSFIKSDIVFFDLENNSFDYESIYGLKFIQRVIDEAVSDFNRSVRDYNALGAENNQVITNP
jgi:hypothetical protein